MVYLCSVPEVLFRSPEKQEGLPTNFGAKVAAPDRVSAR